MWRHIVRHRRKIIKTFNIPFDKHLENDSTLSAHEAVQLAVRLERSPQETTQHPAVGVECRSRIVRRRCCPNRRILLSELAVPTGAVATTHVNGPQPSLGVPARRDATRRSPMTLSSSSSTGGGDGNGEIVAANEVFSSTWDVRPALYGRETNFALRTEHIEGGGGNCRICRPSLFRKNRFLPPYRLGTTKTTKNSETIVKLSERRTLFPRLTSMVSASFQVKRRTASSYS